MQRNVSFGHAQPRHGTITPLVVLSLALLVGMVALTIDGGTLMEDRRHVQAAADAAALAAAAELLDRYPIHQGTDPSGTARAAALHVAAANGFGNAGGNAANGSPGANSVVTVNIAPQKYQAGPNAGQPLPLGYAEVIIQYNANRLFSGVFGSGAIPVCARAVARGQWGPIGNKMVALNETASAAVNVGGSANVNVNGGLLVNSNSSSAVTVASSASLTATSLSLNSGGGGLLGVVGSVLSLLLNLLGGLLGGGGGSSSSAPITYAPPIPDPFRALPAPDPVQLGLSVQSNSKLNISGGSSPVQLNPGVYNGGITIASGASVTLTPGIYFLQGGGLNVSGSSSLTLVGGNTTGVMIYNNWQNQTDAINLGGTGKVLLAPPTSGAYQGMTIFQKRGSFTTPAPALTIVGSGNVNITGTIYAAYSDVTLTGLGGTNITGGQIVADSVNANGSGTMNIDPSGQPTANHRTYGLVE